MEKHKRIALTGFMGVGKSSVARHLSRILVCKRIDLDHYIERVTGRSIEEIFAADGEAAYRQIESDCLSSVLSGEDAAILSLGGGTWTIEMNREMLRERGVTTIWLESSFEHCWQNIRRSRKRRPLAQNKDAALRLFEERRSFYCLADWHFIIRPGLSSFDVARLIADEIFA